MYGPVAAVPASNGRAGPYAVRYDTPGGAAAASYSSYCRSIDSTGAAVASAARGTGARARLADEHCAAAHVGGICEAGVALRLQ